MCLLKSLLFSDRLLITGNIGKTKTIIAPFWSELENKKGGDVWYQIKMDDSTLNKVACDIHKGYPSFIHFKPLYVLVITWENMKPLETFRYVRNRTNTFQAVLATNGLYSFLIYNYGQMAWPSGPNVVPKETFVAGFNSGDDEAFYLMGNVSSDFHASSNVGIPSKWIFRVDTAGKEGISILFFSIFSLFICKKRKKSS